MITKKEAIWLLNKKTILNMYARPYTHRDHWIFRTFVGSVCFMFHLPENYFKSAETGGIDYRLDVTVDEALPHLAGYYIGIPSLPKKYDKDIYFK